MSKPLLSAKNLYCERDRRVLFEGLDLSLEQGELLQIEGANGSGKTTLLRILAGLSATYEGEIYYCGKPLHQVQAQYRSELNYLGHLPGVKAELTPLENLRWYGQLAGIAGEDQWQSALAAVGLFGYEDVPCHMLSAGQQRRVNLARLRAIPAKIWILDEPFTAIDKQGVAVIEDSIHAHVEQGGAVIVTTHQPLASSSYLRSINLDG